MKRRFTIRAMLVLTAMLACVIAAYVQSLRGYQRELVVEHELDRHVLDSDCFEMHGSTILGASASRSSILPSPLDQIANSLYVFAFHRVEQLWINNVADAGIFDSISQFAYIEEIKIKNICPRSFEEFCEAARKYRMLNPAIEYTVDHQPFDPEQGAPPLSGVLHTNAVNLRTVVNRRSLLTRD